MGLEGTTRQMCCKGGSDECKFMYIEMKKKQQRKLHAYLRNKVCIHIVWFEQILG